MFAGVYLSREQSAVFQGNAWLIGNGAPPAFERVGPWCRMNISNLPLYESAFVQDSRHFLRSFRRRFRGRAEERSFPCGREFGTQLAAGGGMVVGFDRFLDARGMEASLISIQCVFRWDHLR